MDSLPSEIWFQIFGIACSDSGQTYSALSLVCKWSHELVEPFKFSAISIKGSKSILRFLYLLESDRIQADATRHLLLASDNPRLNPASTVFRNSDPYWEEMVVKGWIHTLAAPSSKWKFEITLDHVDAAIWRIIKILGPTLVTLSLHFTFLTRSSLFPDIELPQLEQLHLYGPYLSSSASHPVFPRLTHLHLSSPHTHHALARHVNRQTPNLTRIYMSERSCSFKTLKNSLGIVSGDPPAPCGEVFHDNLATIMLEVEDGSESFLTDDSAANDLAASEKRPTARLVSVKRWADWAKLLTGHDIEIVPRAVGKWDTIAAAVLDWEEAVGAYVGLSKKSWRIPN
ncbi:hypothetical protein C8J56DRAFT_141964 [Mycena floridula]|nr:hypothetical protein C8J56DRAFT_141964 [Mycena floridula]